MMGAPIRTLAFRVAMCAMICIAAIIVAKGPGVLGDALLALVHNTVGTKFAIAATAATAIPILLTGLGAAVVIRSGQLDIGQPGQLVVGAVAAGWIGALVGGPGYLVATVALVASAAVGAIWAAGFGSFTKFVGLPMVVVTLVANFFADSVATLVTSTVARDPHAPGGAAATLPLPPDSRLPTLLAGTQLNAGLLLALAAVGIAWWVLTRTSVGYRLRIVGANPLAARLVGTNVNRFQTRMSVAGGALSGLAGGLQVVGVLGFYLDGTLGGGASLAWFGLLVALIVRRSVLGVIPVAFLLAAVQVGFDGVQRDTQVTSAVSSIVQAAVLLTVAFPVLIKGLRAPTGATR